MIREMVIKIRMKENRELLDQVTEVIRDHDLPAVQYDFIVSALLNSGIVAAVAEGKYEVLESHDIKE